MSADAPSQPFKAQLSSHELGDCLIPLPLRFWEFLGSSIYAFAAQGSRWGDTRPQWGGAFNVAPGREESRQKRTPSAVTGGQTGDAGYPTSNHRGLRFCVL